jgi:hypothetical protein
MDWQEMVSLFIVGGTAGFMLWRHWHSRPLRHHKVFACGCGWSAEGARGQSVVFHARKGERPQVLVRLK